MKRLVLMLVLSVILCSCASSGPKAAQQPVVEASKEPLRPLGPPLAQSLLPVNMGINGGQWVNQMQAQNLKYLRDTLVAQKIFADIAFGGGRYPLSVDLEFSQRSAGNGTVEFVNLMVSAASLFLVPAVQNVDYVLTAKFFGGGGLLETRNYAVNSNRMTVLFSSPQKKDQAVIDHLLETMKADFTNNPPLPVYQRQPKPVEKVS